MAPGADLEAHFAASVAEFGRAVETVFEQGPPGPVTVLTVVSRAMASALFAAVEVHADKERPVEAHHVMLSQFLDAYDVAMAAKGRDLRMSKTIARLGAG